MQLANTTLIEVKNIKKTYKKSADNDLLILDEVNFSLHEGEIVALLGKSGSGKSTLMRIIAGLTAPTDGEVLYHGKPIATSSEGIAMVFQNFAIFPWLTVLENVELGLQAKGLPGKAARKKALKAIDTIGLDGFESAYPKELSGGMQQRVGMARAMVVDPEILLMDEPFSALDVLTSENLRSDLLDLWNNQQTSTKSILFITHNIQEAALIADRIIIFGSDPGQVRADLAVSLPQPRQTNDPKFRQLIDDIYTLMTTSEREIVTRADVRTKEFETIDLYYRLPDAGVNELTGLIDTIGEAKTFAPVDLPELAELTTYDSDALFTLLEALESLRFAKVSKGDVVLTTAGRSFAEADILQRKQIFAQQLAAHIPLAKHISSILNAATDNRINEEVLLEELSQQLSDDEAERVLKVIIDWGRYAEIFAYDYDSGLLNLENPI